MEQLEKGPKELKRCGVLQGEQQLWSVGAAPTELPVPRGPGEVCERDISQTEAEEKMSPGDRRPLCIFRR